MSIRDGRRRDTAVSCTRARSAVVVCVALLAAIPAPGIAQNGDVPAIDTVTVHAMRLVGPLQFDGRVDEPVYETTPPVTGFVQQVPRQAAPATERTEAWVFFDGSNLYVAARCWDSAPPRAWVANEMRRDATQLNQNDTFGVLLDTFHDRADGFLFYTNPLGALADQHITDERTSNGDWNPVWSVKTARFEGGWSVEMQIPFKSLRYSPGPTQTWGIQLRRVVRRLNEWSYVTPVPLSAAGRDGSQGILRVSEAATLVGLEVPPGSKNIEIKPYRIFRLRTDRAATPAVVNDIGGDFGMDLKYGLTQNLTADFTYNTDFAQVEADQQQVNLTRFNLQFPEKREFFLEGRGMFDFGRPAGGGGIVPLLFFSRRIGLERDAEVPIVAGGRLTGRVGRYNVGALNIETDDAGLARATNFTVLRVKRNVLRRSSVGVLYTGRSHSATGDGSNHAFGADTKLVFRENVNINGYVAKTSTPGLMRQNTSYQAQFDYPADLLGLKAEQLVVEKHFNPEVGFMRRLNFRRSFAEVHFSPRPRSMRAVRQFTFEGSIDYIRTADTGSLESREQLFSFETEFSDSGRFEADIVALYDRVDEPFEIAKGVTLPPGSYHFRHVELAYTLGRQRQANGQFMVRRGSFYDGTITVVELSAARIEATAQLSIEPGISVNMVDHPAGSFTTRLSSCRATYTFTPRMFVTGLVQHNSENNRVSANVRLRWEYRPGSELFVVYSEDRDRHSLADFTQPRSRGVRSRSIDCSGIDLHRNSGDQGRSPVQKALRLLFFCESDKCVASIEPQNRIVVTVRDRAAILIGHHVAPLSSRHDFRQDCRHRRINHADLFNVRSSQRAAVRVLSAFLLPESARSGPRLASLWRCHSPHRFH